jgi:hypothetical protein
MQRASLVGAQAAHMAEQAVGGTRVVLRRADIGQRLPGGIGNGVDVGRGEIDAGKVEIAAQRMELAGPR